MLIKYTSKRGGFTSTYCEPCWEESLKHMPLTDTEDESFIKVEGDHMQCEYMMTHDSTSAGQAALDKAWEDE